MCTVSGRMVHWCWRYKSGRTTFSNILSIWANKNGDKSAILNWILTTLHWINGRIVINACVKYQKKIFIGDGYFGFIERKVRQILFIIPFVLATSWSHSNKLTVRLWYIMGSNTWLIFWPWLMFSIICLNIILNA